MKKIPLIVFFCMFSLASFYSSAAGKSVEWGRINMQGSITDSTCAIAVASQEQTVDIEPVQIQTLIRDGQGPENSFAISLVNCIVRHAGKAGWKQFQLAFDGEADGVLFGVQGEALGVGLQISDQQGNIYTPGKNLTVNNIPSESMHLSYFVRLVANHRPLKSGDYFSLVRFELDYF